MTTAPSLYHEVAKPDQHPRNSFLHGKYQPTQILRRTHTHNAMGSQSPLTSKTPPFPDTCCCAAVPSSLHLQAAKTLKPPQHAAGHSSEVDAQHHSGLATQPWEMKQALAAYTQEETGGERQGSLTPSSTRAGPFTDFRREQREVSCWALADLVQTPMHMVHLATDKHTPHTQPSKG